MNAKYKKASIASNAMGTPTQFGMMHSVGSLGCPHRARPYSTFSFWEGFAHPDWFPVSFDVWDHLQRDVWIWPVADLAARFANRQLWFQFQTSDAEATGRTNSAEVAQLQAFALPDGQNTQ